MEWAVSYVHVSYLHRYLPYVRSDARALESRCQELMTGVVPDQDHAQTPNPKLQLACPQWQMQLQ